MASLGRLAAILLLVALLSPTTTTHSFPASPFAPLVSRGCLPNDLARQRPGTVTSAELSCRRDSPSAEPLRLHRLMRPGSGNQRTVALSPYLQCLTVRLNLYDANGPDEAALDALIDSLSEDTTWRSRQRENVDECLASAQATLTRTQRGVQILACLRSRLFLDCDLRGSGAAALERALCRRAVALSSSCAVSARTLLPLANAATCALQSLATAGVTALLTGLGQLLPLGNGVGSGGIISDEICTDANFVVRDYITCGLRAAGLAPGDTLDEAALRTLIQAGSDATVRDLQLELLDQCIPAGTTVTVPEFLDCWGERAAYTCAELEANQLAADFTGPSAGPIQRTIRRTRRRRNRRGIRRIRTRRRRFT